MKSLKKNQKKIEKPASAVKKQKFDDFVIHVMPKEFIGSESIVEKKKKNTPKPPPIQKKVIPPPKQIPIAIPKKPVAPPTQPKKKKKLGVFIVVIVLAIVVSGAGYFAWLNTQSVDNIATNDVPTPPVIQEPISTPPTPVEPQEPKKIVLTNGKDTDSDGLSDVEEKLYGTDIMNSDTDSDSFLDGNEVFHGYDPLIPDPATLLEGNKVKMSTVEKFKYSVLYPTQFVEITSSDVVSYRSTTGASFIVSQYTKSVELSLSDWLKETEPDIAGVKEFNGVSDVKGLITPDSRTVWLDGENRVYKIEYDVGKEEAINYLQTFLMFINSFKLTP